MPSTELLLHPVRLRIAQAFLGGRELTTSDLRAELEDVPAASLYRHVNLLAEGGVLTVAAERRVRGAVERTYALRTEAAQVDPEGMTAEDHRQAFMAFVGGLLADLDRYLRRPEIDPVADGLGYNMLALWLTDEEFAAFVKEMEAILDARLAFAPDGARTRRILGTVMLPSDR